MQEVIQKINELHSVLKDKIRDQEIKQSENSRVSDLLFERKKILDGIEEDLKVRQDKIRGIEDAQQILVEAKAVQKQADVKLASLREEEKSFVTWSGAEKQDILNKQSKLDEGLSELKKQYDALISDKKKHEEDKSNMKKRVFEEMAKKLG